MHTQRCYTDRIRKLAVQVLSDRIRLVHRERSHLSILDLILEECGLTDDAKTATAVMLHTKNPDAYFPEHKAAHYLGEWEATVTRIADYTVQRDVEDTYLALLKSAGLKEADVNGLAEIVHEQGWYDALTERQHNSSRSLLAVLKKAKGTRGAR